MYCNVKKSEVKNIWVTTAVYHNDNDNFFYMRNQWNIMNSKLFKPCRLCWNQNRDSQGRSNVTLQPWLLHKVMVSTNRDNTLKCGSVLHCSETQRVCQLYLQRFGIFFFFLLHTFWQVSLSFRATLCARKNNKNMPVWVCLCQSEGARVGREKKGQDDMEKAERGSLMGRREKARKRGDAKVPCCFLSD